MENVCFEGRSWTILVWILEASNGKPLIYKAPLCIQNTNPYFSPLGLVSASPFWAKSEVPFGAM